MKIFRGSLVDNKLKNIEKETNDLVYYSTLGMIIGSFLGILLLNILSIWF